MAIWASHFHKSDGEHVLATAISGIKDDVVQMHVLLGNENTEETLVYDAKTLKNDRRRLANEVQQVAKMKKGFGWLSAGGEPLSSDGRESDFFLDALTFNLYKKKKKKEEERKKKEERRKKKKEETRKEKEERKK